MKKKKLIYKFCYIHLRTTKTNIYLTLTDLNGNVILKLSSGMFCAGYLEGGIDTCQGDSGGGMICEVRGRQSVMGLTSWGTGCGRPNRPGVYTKVSDYLDWITEKLTT